MSYPNWPNTDATFRAVRAGVECTLRTKYKKVKLSVTETDTNEKKAENAAYFALMRKVSTRQSFEEYYGFM